MAGNNDNNIKANTSPMNDSALEQYGVWVKVKPETIDETGEEKASGELVDLDTGEASLSEEEEQLLGELEEESLEEEIDLGGEDLSKLADMPSDTDDISDIESDDFSVTETPEDLPELSLEEAPVLEEQSLEEIEVPLSEEITIDEDFARFESEEKIAGKTENLQEGSTPDVLLKIEQELLDIKQELSALKNELSLLQKPEKKGEEVEVTPVTDDSKGFFNEEEDETIALTGDELDNILNTADITEETVEEDSLSADKAPSDEQEITLDLSEVETAEMEHPGLGETGGGDEEISLESLGEGAEEISLDFLEEEETGEEISLEIPEEEEPALEEISPEPAEGAETGLEEISLDAAEDETELEILELEEIGEEEESPLTEETAPEEISLEIPEEEEPTLEEISPEPAEGAETDLEEISLDTAEDETELEILELEGIGEEETEGTTPKNEVTIGEEGEISLEEPAEEIEEAELLEELPEEMGAAAVEELPSSESVNSGLKGEIKTVLSYMDQLLESLPEDKIEEFAKSDYFEVYKKLFEELGIKT